MNGEVCCILQVCCPPEALDGNGSPTAKAEKALAKELVKDQVVDKATAERVAAWLYGHFELAPAGSLTLFKAEIARLARENPTDA